MSQNNYNIYMSEYKTIDLIIKQILIEKKYK